MNSGRAGSTPRFFLDTYALIEIVRGNPRYRRYLAAELRTSVWNLVGLYLAILRDRGEAEARGQFGRFRTIVVEPDDEWLFEAMALKTRRPRLSYADSVGYTAARRIGARFLTGDEAFRRLPDVEFCR
jgi:predicted nucleic acid-binding protein